MNEKGDSSPAVARIKQAAANNPDNANLALLSARIALSSNNASDALEDIKNIKANRQAPPTFWQVKGLALLRNKQKPYPSKLELLEACKHKFGVVSPSTIEKDLNAMRIEFDAPIAYHKKHNGYAYTDTNFRFLSVNLSEDEKDALGFVENILEQFRGLPIFSEFSDAVDKVLDGLEIAKHDKSSRSYKKTILIVNKQKN